MRPLQTLGRNTPTLRTHLSNHGTQWRQFTTTLPQRARSATVNLRRYATETYNKWVVSFPLALTSSSEVNRVWREAGSRDTFFCTRYVVTMTLLRMEDGFAARSLVEHRMRRESRHHTKKKSELELAREYEQHNPELQVFVQSDQLYGTVYYTLGEIALKEIDGWHLGYFMLQVACEVGHLDAALRLAQFERFDRRLTAGPRAWAMVQHNAEQGSDWRTKVVYAQSLVDRQTSAQNREKAFELAQEAFDMTQPSGTPDTDPREVKLGVWRSLQSLAADRFHRYKSSDDQALIKKAIRAGALEYHDPLACLWFARSGQIDLYSKQWVELMTKAAMDGQPHIDIEDPDYQETAAEDLAKYYLELYEWYPCTGRASPDRSEMLGFEWLEAAAHAHAGNPEHFCKPYLKMAVMMRENGHFQHGVGFLEKGLAQLDGIPADEVDRVRAKAYLQTLIDNWQGVLPPEATLYALFGHPEMVPKVTS